MRIRAVIFDIYGTLLEVGPPPADAEMRWQKLLTAIPGAAAMTKLAFTAACTRIIARHHEHARDCGIEWPEVNWPSVVRQVLPGLAALGAAEQEGFLLQQMQTGHTLRLRPEVPRLIKSLETRCQIGIASNAQAYTLRELRWAFEGAGLSMSVFEPDLCFWSYQHGFSKPDPHVFRILNVRLEARGIGAGEILMVGDRLDNDIEPAQAIGWRTWHLCAPAESNGENAGDCGQLCAAVERAGAM